MKATLTSDGQISLPAEVQAQLGVKPGDDIILEPQNGVCVIRAGNVPTGLAFEGNVLVHHGVSHSSVEDAIKEARDDRLNQTSEGAVP